MPTSAPQIPLIPSPHILQYSSAQIWQQTQRLLSVYHEISCSLQILWDRWSYGQTCRGSCRRFHHERSDRISSLVLYSGNSTIAIPCLPTSRLHAFRWVVIFINVNVVIHDIRHVIVAALVLMCVHDPVAHMHMHTGEAPHLDAYAHACLHARARMCMQAQTCARTTDLFYFGHLRALLSRLQRTGPLALHMTLSHARKEANGNAMWK
jgi:hypothetical protein